MVDLEKFEKLAKMKRDAKELGEDIKKLEKQLIKDGGADKVKTFYGTLALTTRRNISCADKKSLHKTLGTETYVTVSSVSFGAVKKALGEIKALELFDDDYFIEDSVSEFYTLRK